MFDDYKKEVLDCYLKKKNEGNLSLNLTHPTPRRLRDECINAYQERFIATDSSILRLFFDISPNKDDYSESIRNIDIDKFRPLINLINDPKIKSDIKNIELLAWLIDFRIRPYQNWLKEKKSGIATFPFLIKSISRQKIKSIVIAFTLVTLAVVGAILMERDKQCMYWNGSNYIAVECSEIINEDKIALDEEVLKIQRRISQLSEIKEEDIGKVHYIKIKKDSAEFYQTRGNYPKDRKKELRPMTRYIYEKYVNKN